MFAPNTFDKITVRMVFHHITTNLNQAIRQCCAALKTNGTLIVAEGVPPLDDLETIQWYTDMFKLKEDRITFIEDDLVKRLRDNGFKEMTTLHYITRGFSIRKWLINSGIDSTTQDAILDKHYSAAQHIKEAYNMRITEDDCIVDTKNLIILTRKL